MDNLSRVYGKIHELGVTFINTDYDITAVTLEYKKNYGIFLNYKNFKNSLQEFKVLAHEYGHCKTGATHKVNSPYQLIEQHEYRANRAAVHEFLPFEKLINCMKSGNVEVWQIAETLDMPDDFIELAIDVYKREGKLN